ncbi:hypothetical protein HJG60_008821 [Phyllostomus discolor]|uniref:Uncharacterized protein n=1 Tax=Phyllostomus discolor TaxID=89673 RepID=A0A834DFX6_9CHIR|nr:hypothetical protein HJG60_008821 [Phyllostomus discolor]
MACGCHQVPAALLAGSWSEQAHITGPWPPPAPEPGPLPGLQRRGLLLAGISSGPTVPAPGNCSVPRTGPRGPPASGTPPTGLCPQGAQSLAGGEAALTSWRLRGLQALCQGPYLLKLLTSLCPVFTQMPDPGLKKPGPAESRLLPPGAGAGLGCNCLTGWVPLGVTKVLQTWVDVITQHCECPKCYRTVHFSGVSASLQTNRSPVRFPVRAHAWVSGQVPSRGRSLEGQPHTDVSLPLFLPPLPSL